MKVSVVIPNYNHSAYLQQRIDSVLDQTYQDFELILLDDCSTDNSANIIKQYKSHSKVSQIVINETNSGSTFKQWEKGVSLVKGEYIWIAESDDFADERFLENAMQRLKTDESVGLYFSNYHSIDAKSNIVPSNNSYPAAFINHFKNGQPMNGRFFCERYLFFSNHILNTSAVVFKRSLFLAADKSYMQLKIAGDWRMWVNICYKTNIFFDERQLDFFRMHPQNVRSAKAKLMGAEVVQNMIYFTRKTEDKLVKQELKEAICKNWIYSFYLNKKLRLNTALLKQIIIADIFFPVRLLKLISDKLFQNFRHNPAA